MDGDGPETLTQEVGAATARDRADRPRIYVACIASYNAGILHGRWIDVTDPDDIWERVAAMLAARWAYWLFPSWRAPR
jgi:antirestriction protein